MRIEVRMGRLIAHATHPTAGIIIVIGTMLSFRVLYALLTWSRSYTAGFRLTVALLSGSAAPFLYILSFSHGLFLWFFQHSLFLDLGKFSRMLHLLLM